MQTLTQTRSQLPRPPIAADDVPKEELPTRSLKDPTSNALKSVEIRATDLATKQDDCKDGDGVVYSSLESAEAHVVGKIGEIVAADVLDVPLDTNIYLNGDSGYDHQLQAETSDTKTTATDYSKPRLIVSANDTPPADYFILVHLVTDEMARIIGFTDRKTITSRSPRRWPSKRRNYVVDWDELYPPRWFSSLVIGRMVTEARDGAQIHPRGCQLCGAHLDEDTEYVLPVDEEKLETELALCVDCHELLSAARAEERVSEFQIYERP